MENKKKTDKTDTYMFTVMGLFYLYLYGKNVISAAMHITGWDWLFFIILAIIALVVCFFTLVLSYVFALETSKYFGLPKNYLIATILAIIIAPLTIVVLSLFLSGFIPSIFDPRFI